MSVIIVGGGVIGVCAAYYLSQTGVKVTLIEKNTLGGAATHGNACWIATSHIESTAAPGVLSQGLKWMLDSSSPFSIKPRLDLDLIRWLLQFRAAATEDNVARCAPILRDLTQRSLHLYKDLDASGLNFDFAQQGLVQIQFDEKYRKAAIKEQAMLADYGVECHLLDRDDLRELVPNLQPEVEHGLFKPNPAQINPDKFIAAMAARCRAQGVTIVDGCAVLDVETQGAKIVSLKTDQGQYSADQFIFAAGAWTSLLAKKVGDYLPMQPAKGYSITATPSAPDKLPVRAMAVDDYKLAITPLGADFRFSSTLELAGFDPSINEKRLASNWEGLHRTLRGLEQVTIKETWSGYRPLSADGLPIVEHSKRAENLLYATGHGMLGLTLGPVTGEIVVEMLQ